MERTTLSPWDSSNLHSAYIHFWSRRVETFRFNDCAVNCIAISSTLDRLCMVCNVVPFKAPKIKHCYFAIANVWQDKETNKFHLSKLGQNTEVTLMSVFKLSCYRLAFVQNKGTREGKYWPRKRNFLNVTREYLSIVFSIKMMSWINALNGISVSLDSKLLCFELQFWNDWLISSILILILVILTENAQR